MSKVSFVFVIAAACTISPVSSAASKCQVSLLKKCVDWGQLTKHDQGCMAFSNGAKAGTRDCHKCETVEQDYDPCDVVQCRALCRDMYPKGSPSAAYCSLGCSKMAEYYKLTSDSCLCGDATFPPTMSPTRAPSPWYDADGHKANFTSIQDRVRILESIVERMDSLESKFGTAQTQTNSIQSQVTDLQGDLSTSVNALDLLNADMIEQFETHDNQIDSISNAIANAVAALPTGDYTAPTTCDGCSPSIGSEGADVVVSAPGGAVKFSTGSCNTVDLCQDNQDLKQIQAALQKLKAA